MPITEAQRQSQDNEAAVVRAIERSKYCLKPEQAAEYLTIPSSTLASWRYRSKKNGQNLGPRFARVGSLIRYSKEDLDSWLEANASAARR